MALVKLGNFDPVTDGTFIGVVSVFEAGIAANPPTHRRVLITSDDGTCQGYERIADAALFCGPLVAPTPAKTSADAAAAAANDTRSTAFAAAKVVIVNQSIRVRAIAPGTRSDQDKWLLALSIILAGEGP